MGCSACGELSLLPLSLYRRLIYHTYGSLYYSRRARRARRLPLCIAVHPRIAQDTEAQDVSAADFPRAAPSSAPCTSMTACMQ